MLAFLGFLDQSLLQPLNQAVLEGSRDSELLGRSLKDLAQGENVSSYKLNEMTLSTLELSLRSSLPASHFISNQQDRKPLPDTLQVFDARTIDT